MPSYAVRTLLSRELDLPHDTQSLIRVVAGLVRSNALPSHPRPEHPGTPAEYFRAVSAIEGDSIITIQGSRGSGKTTLLIALCMELLEEHGFLVLPISRPEVFRSTDSLISAVVSHVRQLIELAVARGEGRTEGNEILALLLQEALKSSALASPAALRVLTNRPESLSQYAFDAQGILRHNDQLVPSLSKLFGQLRELFGVGSDGPVVIPLDDADLIPNRTSEILTDLRILSSIDGVVPVITVDPEDLLAHLAADIRQEYGGSLPTDQVLRLARAQIRKTLPPDRTVEPTFLTYAKRLEFAPLDEQVPLRERISEVVRKLDRSNVVADQIVRWLTEATVPTNLFPVTGLAWLPENPRALQNLWQATAGLSAALDDRDADAIGPWLARFLDVLTTDTRFSVRLHIESTVDDDAGDIAIVAAASWSPLTHNPVGLGSWRTAQEDAQTRVRFRQLAGLTGSPVTEADMESERAREAAATELPASDVATFLLIEDLFRLPAFSRPRPRAPRSLLPHHYNYLQSIRLLDQETDDRFFQLPWSQGGFFMERSRAIWNRLVSGMPSSVGVRGTLHPDQVVRRYVEFVLDGWFGAASLDEIEADEPRPIDQLIEEAGRAYLRVQADYGGLVEDNYTPAKAYCHWYETVLPRVFHELFLPTVELSKLVEDWQRPLSYGDRSKDALDELREVMRARIKSSISPANRPTDEGMWMCGYRALFEQVDSGAMTDLSRLVEKYDKAKAHGAVGRTTTSEAVEVSGEATGYKFAPKPTPAGIEERELIASVLAQLR